MNVYESVTERILTQLEAGIIPWRKEWKATGKTGLPYNYASGKQYRGINILLLMSSGFNDARWMTYKQAQDAGGNVKRGEKGTKIVFWSLFNVTKKGDTGGEYSTDKVPFAREYTVFNIDQIENLPQSLPFETPVFEPIPAAHSMASDYMKRAGIDLKHGGASAYYSPSLDYVQMPKETDFKSPDAYYSTLFHELGHSTGHKVRLGRDMSGGFGSSDYSKEELVAEFTAAFLCAQVGISNERVEANHAAYIQSWMKAIKNDKKLVVSAAQKAQKAADYIQDKQFSEPESRSVAA